MIDFEALKKEQLKLAAKVSMVDGFRKINLIAGAHQSYFENKIISSVAVCDYNTMDVVEKKHSAAESNIPYKSGYLFYRDGPALIEAFNMLDNKPDVLIIEANGILHPRRIGMASHAGIVLDTAAIGVTKRLMLGEIREGTIYVEKEARGYELVTREHANPIYVIPGNDISFENAKIITEMLCLGNKMPMPIHKAHSILIKEKKSFNSL